MILLLTLPIPDRLHGLSYHLTSFLILLNGWLFCSHGVLDKAGYQLVFEST